VAASVHSQVDKRVLLDIDIKSAARQVGFMKLRSAHSYLKFVDPLLIYIVAAYGVSEVCEFFFQVDSVWQSLWSTIQETLGNGSATSFFCL
jgi:fatty acid hydroxylase domain-containing protein 2